MSETTVLEEQTDQMSFDILSQQQPRLIARLQEALKLGLSAKGIERQLIRKYGQGNLTVALTIGAAYHIEKQGK